MKKTVENKFEEYASSLPEEEKESLRIFFSEFEMRCLLPKNERREIREDFEKALLYYASEGLSLKEALLRLDPSKLGGFYSRPALQWYALEDSAKIYPLSMKHGEMAVFRLSVYLDEEIVPELLQMALSFTLKRFPGFAVSLKKGFFWHYLDTEKKRYPVLAESSLPCSPIRLSRSGSPAFRVLCWGNRISAEFFHVLTDGTGGMEFLKALTGEYLKLKGVSFKASDSFPDIDEYPCAEEYENAFSKVKDLPSAAGFVDRAALQMSGRLSALRPAGVIHFRMSAKQLKETAKRYGATVTVYMLALMLIATRTATDELSGDLSIQVPVNLRKFYPSKTLRNFSLYCWVRKPAQSVGKMPELIEDIKGQLNERASRQSMDRMIAAAKKLVSSVRYVPLFIKKPVASAVYGFLGDKIFTNTLSNLGVVSFPPELAEHIEKMDFLLGTASTNRAECTLVTVGDAATFTVTKSTADPSFEEKMYELLKKDGIELSAEGIRYYEN